MLDIQGLTAAYQVGPGYAAALVDIDLNVKDNVILGVAGESGCGKSSLLKVMYGDVGRSLRILGGRVTLTAGPTEVRNEAIRSVWGKSISYIPQGAMSVLNPVARVETQFLDAIRVSGKARRTDLRPRVVAYLEKLHLPASVLRAYPHQLSGGMRQRVVIAMATFSNPAVILADEPTTGLDVVVQRGILKILAEVQRQTRSTLVIVSHDMGVQYQLTHELAIMYAGRIVERGPTSELFASPQHPYTRALIDSLPRVGDDRRREGLEGVPPRPGAVRRGCPFADRCPKVMDVCRRVTPPAVSVGSDHRVDCHLASEQSSELLSR